MAINEPLDEPLDSNGWELGPPRRRQAPLQVNRGDHTHGSGLTFSDNTSFSVTPSGTNPTLLTGVNTFNTVFTPMAVTTCPEGHQATDVVRDINGVLRGVCKVCSAPIVIDDLPGNDTVAEAKGLLAFAMAGGDAGELFRLSLILERRIKEDQGALILAQSVLNTLRRVAQTRM